MNTLYYSGIPSYNLKELRSVRDPFDNLWNILTIVEAINSNPDKYQETFNQNFNVILFTKDIHRFLVRKTDGFFSMSNPFQVTYTVDGIVFNCDSFEEPVNGKFIAMIRNAIKTAQSDIYDHDDITYSLHESFNLDFSEALKYSNILVSLISNDHGYFRFDEDIQNQNGDIHPRFHFDIFFKNFSTIKIGYKKQAELDCFLSLASKDLPKKYLDGI